MLKKLAAASGAALTCVLTLVLSPSGGPAQALPTSAAATAAHVRVASFNIQSVSLDATSGNQRPWKARRSTVVQQVLGEHPDVIGLQEANPSRSFASRLVSGSTQYLDLRNGLNATGAHYQLTNTAPYNCVRAYTTYKCVYKNNRATWGDRILYNTDTLAMISYGGTRYTTQGRGPDPRFLSWATFRVKATGQVFLFGTTHLRAGDASVRRAQWQQLITRLDQLRTSTGRPVVVVGDFNTQKFDPLAATMLPAMRDHGFGDVLNQHYAENPVAQPRARSTVNAWINSWNRLTRDMTGWSYYNRHDKTGNMIDYVFASNALPVDEFKLVLNYDPRTLQVQGTFPSDHNMIRATLTLP